MADESIKCPNGHDDMRAVINCDCGKCTTYRCFTCSFTIQVNGHNDTRWEGEYIDFWNMNFPDVYPYPKASFPCEKYLLEAVVK